MEALPTILLDMYSPRPISENTYKPGQDPLDVCAYFDSNTYTEAFETPLSVKHIRAGRVRGCSPARPRAARC